MELAMKLSDWANIAEIASAIAVVVSLVYVGLEIGQNTTAVKASTHQAMLDFGREQSEVLVTDSALSNLVQKGEYSPDTLTAHERRQFYEFTTWRMAMWENAFVNHESGLVDDSMWLAWDGYFRLLTSDRPGYTQFWRDNRSGYHSHFMAHIDFLATQ
jgi:hypothetical protein